jgi:hypothetical protein
MFDVYEERDLLEPGVSYVYVAYYAANEDAPSDCEMIIPGADPDDI